MDQYGVGVLPERRSMTTPIASPASTARESRRGAGQDRDRGLGGKRIKHREIFDISISTTTAGFSTPTSAALRPVINSGTNSSFQQKSKLVDAPRRIVPPDGADTEFVDTRAVYDALPDATKTRIEGLTAEHSIWHSRAKLGNYVPNEEERKSRPPAQHPLVRRHVSGRKALYIASHASHIIGMPVEEGRALLDELMAFATQRQFVYAHKWRVGDLVIWDNRCALHRATPYESQTHVRDLRRTTSTRPMRWRNSAAGGTPPNEKGAGRSVGALINVPTGVTQPSSLLSYRRPLVLGGNGRLRRDRSRRNSMLAKKPVVSFMPASLDAVAAGAELSRRLFLLGGIGGGGEARSEQHCERNAPFRIS